MNRPIGGVLRYDQLAALHKPTDAQALAREIKRLRGTGLTPIDISVALRIDQAQVREMLASADPQQLQR